MANVKFPRKEFEKEIKITPEVIEKISLFGTPLESITNEDIEIEVFPNRPDLLSMQGFLRAFKAFLGKDTGLKTYKIKKPENNFKVKIHPSVKSVRPFTACAIVKNLSFNDEKIKEIIELQEKLHSTVGRNRKKLAIGIYPLEKITLPITYKAESPENIKFIPLEMDKELTGRQILQKHPTGREYAHLLEGFEKFPIFVDSKGKVLSMPPIINSHETGKISHETKAVFVECSGFDFKILKNTLNIIVTTLADMGGEINSMILDYGKEKVISPNLSPETMRISLENTNRLLGLNLKESDLQKLLPKMGYDYSNSKVKIPAWRCDILHEVDIIEDIAIAYGYQNLIPEIPQISTIGSESQESITKRKVSELLIGMGLLELSTFHLIKPEEISCFKNLDKIELENSKTEYKLLRPNLLIPTLRILSENKDNEYPQKTFEIGSVFSIDKQKTTETGIKEQTNLIVSSTPGNFTEVKQILDYLSQNLCFSYTLKEEPIEGLIDGRSAQIFVNNKPIGYIGEAHPAILKHNNLKLSLSVLELSLPQLFK